MDGPTSHPTGVRVPWCPLDREDLPWLGIGLGSGLIAVSVYLATNPYPAYGAGLFVQIAEEIMAHGYRPPTRVPGYTVEGVPFAYPPLQLYLLAVLLDLGADPVAVSRLLPSFGLLMSLVPVYLLGRDFTASRPAGAAASVAVAVNPQLLQWHISAGGVVRVFAFLYAMTAIYAGYHAFARGSRRAVTLGIIGFGVTLLSHPTYALFVVVSYLLMWGFYDRSSTGFAKGAIVGFGGAVIAFPWLAWVVSTHGPGVLAAAAGTHGGVGGGAPTLQEGLSLTLLPLAGAIYLFFVRRDAFLLGWTATTVLVFAQPRFVFTVGAFVVAAIGADVGRRIAPIVESTDTRAGLAAASLVLASVVGGAYLFHEMTLPTDPSTPEYLDSEALDAMTWAAAETPTDATFVVVGDAAEWFPALSDRTILIGPWGIEWRDPGAYDRQLGAFETVSRCQSVDCIESVFGSNDGAPDYVYVPKGRYTVRGESIVQFGTLERSFERSPTWETAYENDGVVVYRATD